MNELVLDASVILKWFRSEGETHAGAARSLRREFEAGQLIVVLPSLAHIEILNVAGRRWSWHEDQLVELAEALDGLRFQPVQPDLRSVARWTARGLTAYDAAYVAVAETTNIQLVTDDEYILARAPEVATPLQRFGEHGD